MAQQIITSLVDDIDGGEAHETVPFQLDGKHYEIDLSTDNATKLRAALAEFVEKARRPRQTGPVSTRRRSTAYAAANGETPADRKAIRDWATEQGYNVPARGRISQTIRDAYADYKAAHATN